MTIKIVNEYHERHPNPYRWPSVKEDHIALLTLIDRYNVKTIFEFGTWEGYTTQLLAEQPAIEKVFTLDIHKDIFPAVNYDHPSHGKTLKENYGKFIKSKKVEQIFHDSLTYKPDKKVDMVFIDGNHDFQHVRNDTQLALKMNPKIIAWHDYDSPGNPGVKVFIDLLISEGKKIKVFPNSIVAYLEVEK